MGMFLQILHTVCARSYTKQFSLDISFFFLARDRRRGMGGPEDATDHRIKE
jgi:hypothetical protein